MLRINSFPRPDYTCLFSTKTSAVIALKDTVYERISRGDLNGFTDDTVSMLRRHFLIDDQERETAEVLDGIKVRASKSSMFNLTIVTTTDCNFACKYCAIEGLKSCDYMSEETADDILAFLEKKCGEGKGIEQLNVYYYGGEPLLNKKIIDYLTPRIKELCTRYSIRSTLNITTNGVYLDAAYAQFLLGYFQHINALISIDGPVDVQNHRRPSIDGTCSYTPVLRNVVELSSLINVTLKINLDRENSESFSPLLDDLLSSGLHNKIRVLIEPVTDTHNPTVHCVQNTFTNLLDYKFLVDAWERQIDKGFELSDINIVEGSTCGNSLNSITCNTDGSMYSCTGMCRTTKLQLANVHNNPPLEDVKERMQSYIRATFKECLACPYLPMCNGGCRTQAYIRNGDINSRLCRRPQYDYLYPEYIKLKYHKYSKKS